MISEIMDGGGEDWISNLPDDVVGHILSRLPTKDAVQTSILSKDWEYKWTSIYDIQLDNRGISLRGKMGNKTFVSFLERVLRLTRNSRIRRFSLSCSTQLDSQYLKTCIAGILMRGVQYLEINTYQCGGYTFVNELYNCRSLTELKLVSCCTLFISLMKNCFNNLKVLHLGRGVCLSTNKISNTCEALLNFPVLEELEIICCVWRGVKSVKINAPALIRFVAEGHVCRLPNDYVIKIDGPKLEKFESRGLLDNYVVATPSISNAVLTNWGGGATLGFRVYAILKGFLALEYLKLSGEAFKALTISKTDFPLPCFNRLKQLELDGKMIEDPTMVKEFLQVMPSLGWLSINVDYDCGGLRSFPLGIASRLEVIELVGFGGIPCQLTLAMSVLKNAGNLETLIISVCNEPVMPKIEIMNLFSIFPKSSTHVTIEVNESRIHEQN